jgi:putative transposase
MVRILREADTTSVAEVAKKHAISDGTIYQWRKRFGKLEAVDVKRLRQVEAENAKLKKLLAERDLEIDAMKEISRKNGERMRTSTPGSLRQAARDLGATSVCAVIGGQIDAEIRVASGNARCAGFDDDARTRRAVPALRISTHPGLPGTSWTDHPAAPPDGLTLGRSMNGHFSACQDFNCFAISRRTCGMSPARTCRRSEALPHRSSRR